MSTWRMPGTDGVNANSGEISMKRYVAALFVLLSAPVFSQQPVPELAFDSVPNFFKLPPDIHLGEGSGVAVNSKGHVFVFTRANTAGPAYAATATQLLE